MAKYEIMHICGHTSIVNLFGQRNQRVWQMESLRKEKCPDCKKIELEEINKKAAEENAKLGLPQLEGTEKQIFWAESIRKKMLGDLHEKIEKIIENPDAILTIFNDEIIKNKAKNLIEKSLIKDVLNEVYTHTTHSWKKASIWIDNRYNNIELEKDFVKILKKYILDETPDSYKDDDWKLQEEVIQEATIYPNNDKKVLPVKVVIKDDKITIDSNDNFIQYKKLKDIGYTIISYQKAELTCYEQYGNIIDRAAEAIAVILEMGVPVRCFNQEAREKAIKGNYEPYDPRWIYEMVDNMVVIPHLNSNEIYKKIRAIHGSKWDRQRRVCLVPIEMYESILGFAQIQNYKISRAIKEKIQKLQEISDKKLIVPNEFSSKKLDKSHNPQINTKVEINPELLDK